MESLNTEPRRRQGNVRPPLPPELVAELKPLLAGGDWIPRSIVEEIGARYHVQLASLGEGLGLAESDLGAFVCIPTPETPLQAPDEALQASGEILAVGIIVRFAVREWRKKHGMPVVKPEPRQQKAQQLELAM